jgi:tRNA(His) guanylyltransferase
MKDSLGDRMKGNYEERYKLSLMRRAYTIIRIDGKAFHTYTKGFKKPFDDGLMEDMDTTAVYLCKKIMGAKLAFVQSDEISILLTDFDELTTQAWFDNEIQKLCSVSASMTTACFNRQRYCRHLVEMNDLLSGDILVPLKDAEFDSRVFQLPTKSEVSNYFVWRQQDTVRNSISSVAQSLYSPKELHGKSSNDMQEMIFQKGINWNEYAPRYKRGRVIRKEYPSIEKTGRGTWLVDDPPIFTQDREYLNDLIPNND